MKEIKLPPAEICRMVKIAHDTFGTFEFTHIPDRIKRGEDVTNGPDANFWEDNAFCACFFPKLASGYVDDRSHADDDAHFETRKRGFEQVCHILGCNGVDEVVAIRPEL